ncbi:3-deoxy-D-manno-octulosonic acid transferase [Sneathiella sp. CAU 1612]|uniref:3-deoxy-D-manno-octulosonic acid transferase n=1 Tax=Sneathiella sedimenti TaxID=2816034 RepID=A0ABS3F736_9PROT|nr:3-deoxy-D-manno-octulosonic acid transferase [Sneathiella sedimenti]MBO0334325.1 3-deoxy-D-manno-octulosonic acid transferase [Sneathiella sedimenti]
MQMALYNGLLWIGAPVLRRHMKKRLESGKEDPDRFQERLGTASLPRPEGELIWIHAASVGESISALPLIEGLLKSAGDRKVLVTTGTRTSAEIMASRLPDRTLHQYVPIDMKRAVRCFLDHWRPDLAIWIESEIWPNLIVESAERGIPMMMANARITEKSFQIWQKSLGFSRKLLRNFHFCSAQSEDSAARLRELGAHSVECFGNLKFAAEPLPVDPVALATLTKEIAGRPLWLAASTHRGEDEFVLAAHGRLRQKYPDLLTIIVPRHPERGGEVAALAADLGINAAQRSRAGEIETGTGVYVADTIGELGLFYRLAKIVFIGGSLVPTGGQNPLEAARLDCALLHGPHMDNFADVMQSFDEHAASVKVTDEETLAVAVAGYMDDPATRDEMAERASRVVAGGEVTLQKTLEQVEALLSGGAR